MHHPFRTPLIVAVALGGLIALALAIAVWTVDANRFVPVLVERVRTATGRDLRVEGGVSLKVGREPRIELRNVALSNPSWAKGPALVAAKRVDVQVALWPLLHRRLEVREIALVEPVIALETDAAGHGNWELASERTPPAAGSDTAGQGVAIAVGELRIEGGLLTYRSRPGAQATEVRLDRLVLHGADPEAPLDAQMTGSVAGVPLSLSVHAGTLASLRAREVPYPVVAEGEIAGKKAKLDTKIAFGPSTTRLDPFAASLGNSSVSGSVAIATDRARRRLTIKATAPQLHASDLAFPSRDAGASRPAAPVTSTPSAFLVPDTPLPLGFLHDVSADGEIAIGDLEWAPDRHAQTVRVVFALDRSRLDLSTLEATIFGGRVAGKAALDAAAAPPQLELHLTGRDLDLGTMLAVLGAPREVRGGKSALRVDLVARGSTPHAWASTANGNLELVVGTATLVNPKAETASVLTQLSAAMNPLHATERATELKCAVVRTPIANGVARFDRTVAVETQTLGVSGSGTVNLRDETLDVALHPTLRQGLPIDIGQVADLVRARGPWRNPRVTVDATSSVTTVARLGAVIAGGGLPALGGALVLGAATQEGPCAVALGATTERKSAPRTKADAPKKPAEDLLQGLGRLFQR